MHATVLVALTIVFVGCAPSDPSAASTTGTMAFGVFGDAPYSRFDERAYQRLLEDASASGIGFLIHIGDLHGGRCSDKVLEERLRSLSSLPVPVVYTPGDNEWTDCHGRGKGGFAPLERLQRIRASFFANPRVSLGRRPLALATQGERAEWSEFVENARWVRGGFVFTTVHLVGSANGTESFPGRAREDDDAADRRLSAANAWLDEAFALATRDSMHGVVVAMHADPYLELRGPRNPFESFITRLARQAATFSGIVVLLHGDTHSYRVDQPLLRPDSSDTLRTFTRVETFGSPDVGWVRIVVDTINGRVAGVEPRLMPKRLGQ